jgi:molybdopterin molybdotransferase
VKQIRDSLTPEQAWHLLQSASRMPVENRSTVLAFDHCLSQDQEASEDVPPGPRSFMDGYAVRAADVSAAPVRLKVVEDIAMGRPASRALEAGEAMSIPTGGFLPEGADAVVMQEQAELISERDQRSVLIKRPIAGGENVQSRAEDFRKGDVLFGAGHRLRPQDIAALATFGITSVSVHRKPRIHILSTGDELVDHADAGKMREQIRESNSLALSGAAQRFLFETQSGGIIPDDPNIQRAAVAQAMRDCDVILISGGSSVGARDYTMQVIESFSAHTIFFHGLAIRPGNPTIFAQADKTWIFGLPGQPVSSLIVFYQFVLPFLFHISGEIIPYPRFPSLKLSTVEAKLSAPIVPLQSKTDYVRVRLQWQENEWMATPVPGKSASLSTLAKADGYTIVFPGTTPLPNSSVIEVVLFP